jgi:copper ion binding protein
MYELQVEGMTCKHCVGAVTKSVQAIDTHAKVEVDLTKQKVLVDSQAALDKIASAIIDAGYSVTRSAIA